MQVRRAGAIVFCCIAAAVAAAPAEAADPGRWVQTGSFSLRPEYMQGFVSDGGAVWFAGPSYGLYRLNAATFAEQARNDDVIPKDVANREGYNHIGDITSGSPITTPSLLLPLECYEPLSPDTNGCHTGSIGVADPQTLKWLFYVKLDPAEIPKAMWLAADPATNRVWTSAGADILAYKLSDITEANAAPAGPVLHAVTRLAGAVPPGGITGATMLGGRLFVANQDGTTVSIFSIDTTTGQRQLEVQRPPTAGDESEGLDFSGFNNGVLHLNIARGVSFGKLASYLPRGTHIRLWMNHHAKAGRKLAINVHLTVATASHRVPLSGVQVTLAGAKATTDATGNATLHVKLRRGRHTARATLAGLVPAHATVRAT